MSETLCPSAADAGALRLYLRALFGHDPETFIEIAHRREWGGKRGPMHRGRTGIFLSAADLESVARKIVRLARSEHVWVGVVPRRPEPQSGKLGGTKAHVAPARAVWVDCDTKYEASSLERLLRFRPQPHLVVASGGGHHAYWLLAEALGEPERLRAANERLALALAADAQAADAARILRPPGTLNYKAEYGEPRPVRLVFAARHRRYSLDEVVADLPPLPARAGRVKQSRGSRRRDALQRIAPACYFKELAGVEPDRGGKVPCPLPGHDDPEPSCHVYELATQGWYCYGCGHGGDIYELAGALWGLRREGREFTELRRLLERRFQAKRRQAPPNRSAVRR